MLTALHEAGWVSWFAPLAALVGLALALSVGRRTGRAGGVATAWSIVVLIVVLLNASVGQHKVDAQVQQELELGRKMAILTTGTREASSNLFVGGASALFLMAAGGLLSLRRALPQD
jgi:hypothetical protein